MPADVGRTEQHSAVEHGSYFRDLLLVFWDLLSGSPLHQRPLHQRQVPSPLFLPAPAHHTQILIGCVFICVIQDLERDRNGTQLLPLHASADENLFMYTMRFTRRSFLDMGCME
jgi:hypothetical protein